VKITCIQFCAIPPHEGVNVMYSTKVEYATGITLGRFSSYRVQCKKGIHIIITITRETVKLY
jgi:hypothetical protein